MSTIAEAAGALLAWLTAGLAALGLGGGPERPLFNGYVEGEYVYVAAPEAGTLARLEVARGQRVAAGAPLFALDLTRAKAERDRACAALVQAKAELADLEKGDREEELAVLAAQKAQAEASMELARLKLERQSRLVQVSASAVDALDTARETYAVEKARVAELGARWDVANLPARADRIRGAEAGAAMAAAELARAERRLAELAPAAPAEALVEDTLFEPGEWVAANAPVVSLLPPEAVKLRFFVPEPMLATLELGQPVAVACDGCPAGLSAKISYIAPQAEYTPPVIYSVGSREKLVFRVEARPDAGVALHPGLPVDVSALP
jgi:HlyD family secretion protein